MAAKSLKNSWMFIPILATILLYLPSVQLPFFSDDIIHLRGVTTVDSQYIATHADLGMYYANNYYRPVVNLILRTQYVMGITPSAPFWHWMMVLTHALNTALVGVLAKQLRANPFVQLMTMLLFAVFPFNYQVVVWVLAWFHSLVLLTILLTCAATLRYIQNPKEVGMLALAIFAGVLAPFIHENGLFATAILLLILMFVPQFQSKRMLPILVPSGIAAVGYFYLRTRFTGEALPLNFNFLTYLIPAGFMLTVMQPRPIYVTQEIHIDAGSKKLLYRVGVLLLFITSVVVVMNLRGKGIWTAYHLKTAYFTQGISYPVQWLAHYAPLSPEKQVWLGGLIFGAIWVFVFRFAPQNRRLMLLAVGWFGLTCMLPILKLNDGYTLSSPRLFYVGAPAIALTLALLIDQLRGYSNIAGGLIFVAVVTMSVDYVVERQGLYLQLDAAYDDLIRQLPADENATILIANAPRWLASRDNPFPLDNMGAVFVPDYFPFEEYLRVNTGREYHNVTMVTDVETMYLWERVTGIGDSVDHATFIQLAEEQDFVYTFHMGE